MITLQVGVKAFLRNKEGKYLLVKRNAEKYNSVRGSWDIVGGRINPEDNLHENLEREVLEETQLSILSEPALVSAQDILPSPDMHIVRLTYVAETDGEPILDMSENTECKWLTLDEIAKVEDLDIYVKEILAKGLIE